MTGANIKDIDPLITFESNEIQTNHLEEKDLIKGLVVNEVIQNESKKQTPSSPVIIPH